MVGVCKKHVERLPKAQTFHIVEKKDCKLCKLTEEEIEKYVEYRKNHNGLLKEAKEKPNRNR